MRAPIFDQLFCCFTNIAWARKSLDKSQGLQVHCGFLFSATVEEQEQDNGMRFCLNLLFYFSL